MKRSPIKIGLVLLGYFAAGAVVSVVVAWGIAVWVPLPLQTKFAPSERIPDSLHMVPADWPSLITVRRRVYFGVTETRASFDLERVRSADARWFIRHEEHGWPLRSMEWWVMIRMPHKVPGQTPWQNGIAIPSWVPRFKSPNTEYSRSIGLHPDMPGFAINAVFYGAILWVTAACVQRFRSSVRRRGGLCPKCAYPMGISGKCTECGHDLPRRVVSVRGDGAGWAAIGERASEG